MRCKDVFSHTAAKLGGSSGTAWSLLKAVVAFLAAFNASASGWLKMIVVV